jgi:hypothetical protein
MPVFEITSPDGRTFEVNAPDGATQDQVLSYAQQNFQRQEQPKQPMSRTDKVLTGMADPIHGGAQLLTKMLPDSVVSGGNALNNWMADKTGLVPRLPAGGVDQQVREREQAYQQQRQAAGESGFDGYRTVGNVLSPANMGIATGLPAAATLGGRIAAGAAGGAATSALNPVTEGDFAGEKLKQVGLGAGFGAAVPAVTGGLARLISPNASTNPQVQMLRREGVTPTVGQALGGRFNSAEEKLTSVPILGDAISNARGRSLEQFNNAAINRATAPIGVKVQGTGQDAVREAGDAIGRVYDQGKNMLGGFRLDQQATTELATLRNMAQTGLEGRERRVVEGYFKDYLQKPALTAEAFKELDSKLAKDAAKYSGSSDVYQQKVGEALAEVRKVITESAKRANPQAAEVLKKADRAYANMVRVEGASKAGMNNGGMFTPGQLNSAVRQSDKSVRDRATARGTALMQDLGSAGQAVLGNKVPNSFTTDRALLAGGSLGSYFLDPTIPVGLLAAGAMYTKPMQSLLSGAVSARPQGAKALADAVRKSAPLLVPAGSQVGLGLLN